MMEPQRNYRDWFCVW